MSSQELQDYKKKLKLYDKLLTIWNQLYGDVQTAGPGTNPPPPPPPPPPGN